ncbi:hypothetical protein MVEN_02128000 [Mycena venus]|uniref:DUF6534 domain-containing protein n=1 Tax=Mycena venus TaxID=2733690 RepID=A0A8H6X9F7_9AGAR|nr:hypothetical protein MVEN_02128000 [Mycena venus]
MSLSSLDTVTGALLVGTWVSSLLYTVEIFQLAYYYRHFKNDGWMLKLFVSLTCAVDAVAMIGNYAGVYLYTITHAGDAGYLVDQNWPVPLSLFTTGIVAASVQLFLVIRYWKLTKKIFITLILLLFILIAISGAFVSGVEVTIFPAFADRGKVKIPVTTWLVSEAVTDISITTALIWEFRQAKAAFKGTRSSILNRLVAQTVQTGAACATIAFATLITYLLHNESNVPVGIAYCLGRVYVITMLANLNIRQSGRTRSSRGTSSSVNDQRARLGVRAAQTEGSEEYGGIQFRRMVYTDNSQDFSLSFKSHPDQTQTNESPADDIEMMVNDSASYSFNKK